MHELSVCGDILAIVLRHAKAARIAEIGTITIEAGELSDVAEIWLQRYFTSISRGTAAEHARLEVLRVPAVFDCGACGCRFSGNFRESGDRLLCPRCGGGEVLLVSGDQCVVKSMEGM